MRAALSDRRRRSFLAALALLLACAAPPWVNADEVFEVLTNDLAPVMSSSLPGDGLGGLILHALARQAGQRVHLKYMPHKRLMKLPLAPGVAVIGNPENMAHRSSRAIIPLLPFRSTFFYYAPKPEQQIHGLQDLPGHSIGVLLDTVDDKAFFAQQGIRLEESRSVESLLKKLKRGRIDFCLLMDLSAHHAIETHFPGEADDFVRINIPGSVRPVALMIDAAIPQSEDLARRYWQAMDVLMASGDYRRIVEDYFGKGRVPNGWFLYMEQLLRDYRGQAFQ